MKSPSLLEIVDKVLSKILIGRFVKAIFGAIDNPTPPSVIPDTTRLQTDKEVKAFYDITAYKPIHLQVILYRDSTVNPVVPDSLPPYDEPYFLKDFLYATEHYRDPVEDSDNLATTLARKAKRTFLSKDEAFENRKSQVRKRIRWQKKVVRLLKAEHKRKFPN